MWSQIFPGQGSQSPLMGKVLYDEFKVAKESFEEASDTLSLDFKKICFDGENLNLTQNTQPAILLVSITTWRVLKNICSFTPKFSAGHSVGEYSACVASGVFSFSEALKAVSKRGQFMQEAVPEGEGAMLAVLGLSPKEITDLCEEVKKNTGKVLEPANFNTSEQTVISGDKTATEWLLANYKNTTKKVKFIPLKVSAPFHCSLMKPAEEKMKVVLDAMSFQKASPALIQNVHASTETDPQIIKDNLIKQISAPVRWVECINTIKENGGKYFLELGHGKILTGLLKKIDPELKVLSCHSKEDISQIEKEFHG